MPIFSANAALRGALVVCSLSAFQALAIETGTAARLNDEFRQAERLYWLDNWVKARPLYADCEQEFAVSDPAKALVCKFSRLRADAETDLSYYTVSKIISRDLETETARTHPEVRLRGLIVKATADLSIHDPVLSGQEWEQVEEIAHSLKENGWEGRAKGNLVLLLTSAAIPQRRLPSTLKASKPRSNSTTSRGWSEPFSRLA